MEPQEQKTSQPGNRGERERGGEGCMVCSDTGSGRWEVRLEVGQGSGVGGGRVWYF